MPYQVSCTSDESSMEVLFEAMDAVMDTSAPSLFLEDRSLVRSFHGRHRRRLGSALLQLVGFLR